MRVSHLWLPTLYKLRINSGGKKKIEDQKMLNAINTACASELFSSLFTLFSNYIISVNYQISWIGLVEIYGKHT